MTNCNTPTNIAQKIQKNNHLGRYATKLPKFLASVFSNPRLTCASTTLFCEVLGLGQKEGALPLSKTSSNVSYIKNTVVPFLSKLKTLENKPIFSSITYKGDRTITFILSDGIYHEVLRSVKKNDYVSVNLDDLAKLRGKYAKQIYLLLCKWRREKTLFLGFKQVNKLFSLPKSYQKRFSDKVLCPAITQINTKTNLQAKSIQTTQKGWLVAFYRYTKGLQKIEPKDIKLIKDKAYLERKRRLFWEILKKKTPQKHASYNYLKIARQKRELLVAEDYLRKKGKLKNYSHRESRGSVHPSCTQRPSLDLQVQQG